MKQFRVGNPHKQPMTEREHSIYWTTIFMPIEQLAASGMLTIGGYRLVLA